MQRLLLVLLASIICTITSSVAEAKGFAKAWQLPADATKANRDTWKKAEAGSDFKTGGALENGKLLLLVVPGHNEILLLSDVKDSPTSVSLRLLDANKKPIPLGKVRLILADRSKVVFGVKAGDGECELELKTGQSSVELRPGNAVATLDLKAKSSFSILPDFFGHDVVYDPAQLKPNQLNVPAENFLLNFLEGERAILMCVWQGTLSLGKKPGKNSDKDPNVEIQLAGEGAQRHIESSQIEFLGKPIHIALLEKEGIWKKVDLTQLKEAQKPQKLDWKRPFEAKWRASFLVATGNTSADWHTSSQSFDVMYPHTGKKLWGPWKKGNGLYPKISLQGLWPYFIYPFYFKDKDAYLAPYADMVPRKVAEKKNKSGKKAAKKAGTAFVEAYPPNIYAQALIYSIDRHKDTPLDVFTPVDIMRETLGQGPCEYVLDVQGVKPRMSGGERNTLGATCGIYSQYISKIMGVVGRGGSVYLGKKKYGPHTKGEKLGDDLNAMLIRALEDMNLFVRAVNARVEEYKSFNEKLITYCDKAEKQTPKIKPLIVQIRGLAEVLKKRYQRPDALKFDAEKKKWNTKIGAIVSEAKEGEYKNLKSSGGIRRYAEHQDIFISFARRDVKAIHQAISLADVSEPATKVFALKVREMCHGVLRNRHQMEGK